MNPLAIIIPAFKLSFFEQALKSIAAQTCKRFTLYIGDDDSPEDLLTVVKKFQSQLNIVYKKFDQNLGKKSVVKHWERCVALAGDEEWIWLFSDDDVMSKNCVEEFYKTVMETDGGFDVYRFNCAIINETGETVGKISNYPQVQTSSQFLMSRLSYQFHSYIVNAIFSRKVYDQYRGFVNFAAAWCSDDATWIRFAQAGGIYTMERGSVNWRQSGINISGNRICPVNRKKKYDGSGQFVSWLYDWALQNDVELDDSLVSNWYYTMLNLIGYKKRIGPYLLSEPFRRHFLGKGPSFHYKLLKRPVPFP